VHIALTAVPAVADFMTAVPIAFKFPVPPLILEMTSHDSSAVSISLWVDLSKWEGRGDNDVKLYKHPCPGRDSNPQGCIKRSVRCGRIPPCVTYIMTDAVRGYEQNFML